MPPPDPPPSHPPSTTASEANSSAPLQPAPPPPPPPPLRAPRRPPRCSCKDWVRAAGAWLRGPDPPVDVSFVPLWPAAQQWPSARFRRVVKQPHSQALVLAAYCAVWFALFAAVVHYSAFADAGLGAKPLHLSCGASLWGKNDECGLNGDDCRPFANESFAFRCPAGCIESGRVLNPRAVGDQLVAFRPFVVGGGGGGPATAAIYRADSFICPAAIHAGFVSDRFGGCGVLRRTGEQRAFAPATRHGIASLGFDARFPSSFALGPAATGASCRDLRWHLLAVSVPFAAAFSFVVPPPAAAAAFYAAFTGVFFHVALASDPPSARSPYDLVSRALARFVPAAFVAHVLWLYVLRPSHRRAAAAAPVERTLLFHAGLWLGALTNITLDRLIPINRLTGRDLAQQPGAKAALAAVVLVLLAIVLVQAHHLRLAGALPPLLALYAGLGSSLSLLAAIPGTALRIHHYLLALLLLPGCRLCTRPSLFYQGLLVGLFINGVARWGFASIVETPAALRGGDGLYFSAVPALSPPPVVLPTNITLSWDAPAATDAVRIAADAANATTAPSDSGVTGVSVLLNDVERHLWPGGLHAGEWTFARPAAEKLYVRIAWTGRSGGAFDYSRAGVIAADGSWQPPPPGWS